MTMTRRGFLLGATALGATAVVLPAVTSSNNAAPELTIDMLRRTTWDLANAHDDTIDYCIVIVNRHNEKILTMEGPFAFGGARYAA